MNGQEDKRLFCGLLFTLKAFADFFAARDWELRGQTKPRRNANTELLDVLQALGESKQTTEIKPELGSAGARSWKG